jgi:hypothetical protein
LLPFDWFQGFLDALELDYFSVKVLIQLPEILYYLLTSFGLDAGEWGVKHGLGAPNQS